MANKKEDRGKEPVRALSWVSRSASNHRMERSARRLSGWALAILACFLVILVCRRPGLDDTRSLWSWNARMPPSSSSRPSNSTLSKHASIPLGGAHDLVDQHSLKTLSNSVAHEWEETLNILRSKADRVSLPRIRISGVPGTSVSSDEEARALQRYLDCTSSHGKWVFEPGGDGRRVTGLTIHKHSPTYAACDKKYYKGRPGPSPSEDNKWDVRSSLKWRWIPDESCFKTDLTQIGISSSIPPHLQKPLHLSRVDLCHSLRRKGILFVGDGTTQFLVHDILLDWTRIKPVTCYGDLYCAQHVLCDGDLHRTVEELASTTPITPLSPTTQSIEGWYKDEAPFYKLPGPPSLERENALDPRSSQEGHDEGLHGPSLRKRGGQRDATLFRYRRSDSVPGTASAGHNKFDPDYTHPATGVREMNLPWVADTRRSDLVVWNKAPLPLPIRGFNSTLDNYLGRNAAHKLSKEDIFIGILRAARALVKDVWLPEVLQTLHVMRSDASPNNLIIYRGGWRMQGGCSTMPDSTEDDLFGISPGDGPPPWMEVPELADIFGLSPSTSSSSLTTVFYNIQITLQNDLLRNIILPRFGIPFLDAETIMSVWRSGLIGSSVAKPASVVRDQVLNGHHQEPFIRSASEGDCNRYCLPSPGMGLEEVFIGGMQRIFQWGWGGSEENMERWGLRGGTFVPVRERKH